MVARSHGLEHLYWRAFQQEVSDGYERCSIAHRLYFGGLRLWEVERAIRAADLFICHTYPELEFVTRHGWKSRSQIGVTPSGVPPTGWTWPSIRSRETGSCGRAPGNGPRASVCWSTCSRPWQKAATCALPSSGPWLSETSSWPHSRPMCEARVDVIPDVPHDRMPELFKTHSVLLATSVYEGFGAIVAEAMATGLPVVASRAGGWPQYVRSADTGVLVDTWDRDAFVRRVPLAAQPLR